MIQSIFGLLMALCLILPMPTALAGQAGQGKKILYVPIDNRPVNMRQTVEAAQRLGYDVVVPPDRLLGCREDYGHPEELWAWLHDNARAARAAVVSSDAMIYGSLVGSRKHVLSKEEIMGRAGRFRQFREEFPALPTYVLSTIMRTPRSGAYSSVEPAYYAEHGARIFRYTALRDKAETERLRHRERRELRRLAEEIPQDALGDWMGRRAKNYDANACLVDLAREGAFKYLLMGCDDSAIHSQTHLESRHLEERGRDIGTFRFQVASGADELGMLMLARAILDDQMELPLIYVDYNIGKGGDTVPTYTNAKISTDIACAIHALGGIQVTSPRQADLVLAVNTNPDGKTPEANDPANGIKPRRGTMPFMAMVKEHVFNGRPVGIADIAYGNGADNALMEQIRKEGLQFRLRAYGGWNTATNSTGFLLGAGMLAKWMDEDAKNAMLLTRYLDDWGYQANVRGRLANALGSLPGEGDYGTLAGKREAAMAEGTAMIARFAADNIQLPPGRSLEHISMAFPWNRMFESDISFALEPEEGNG